MDLREFVTVTLAQIVQGVKDAGADVKKLGAEVSPHITGGPEFAAPHGLLFLGMGNYATTVQFDVALTVKEGTGTKGGIGVFAGAFTLGSSGQSSAENSAVSRVKFTVPLSFRQ